MYIAPNGDIQFFQNIPLDPSYRHVMKFSASGLTDSEARDTYFDRYYATHAFSTVQIIKSQYTRIHAGVIKCYGETYLYEQYNYMRFRNNITGGKTMWYYAFVTEVRYLSSDVTEVHFMIDIFTTFFPFVTLKESFIERCHTASDALGEHILPEPDISISDYVYEPVTRINDDVTVESPVVQTVNGRTAYSADGRPVFKNTLKTAQPVDFQNWVYIVASTFMLNGGYRGNVLKNAPFQLYESIVATQNRDYIKSSIVAPYNGLYFTVLYTSDEVNQFLTNSVSVLQGDESAGIVGIYMYPYDFIRDVRKNYPDDRVAYPNPMQMLRIQTNTNWGNIDGNHIRNNKLYTYPYTYFTVTTHDGQKIDVRQEEFTGNYNASTGKNEIPQFMWFSVFNLLSATPQSILYPGKNHWLLFESLTGTPGTRQGEKYQGTDTNTSEKLSISSYPMCSYKTDAYMSWLAQNQGKLNIEDTRNTVNLVNGLAGTVLSFTGMGQNLLSSGVLSSGAKPKINQSVPSLTPNYAGIGGNIAGAIQNYEDWYFNRWVQEDTVRVAQNQPPVPHGSDSASADILSKSFGFRMWCVHLKPQTAKIVDDYFTMFGYNQQCYAVPNPEAREGFTYIRTKGVNLTGQCPQEYLTRIRQAFDSGITFWKCDSTRLIQSNIRNEESPLSWIHDYSLNDTAGLHDTDYQTYTLTLSKSMIQTGFSQIEYYGIPVYTKQFDVPVPADSQSVSVTAGTIGLIYQSVEYLDIPYSYSPAQTQGRLTDLSDNPVVLFENPVTEIVVNSTAGTVTLYINRSVLDAIPDESGTVSYSWIYDAGSN